MITNYTTQQFEEAITTCGYQLMRISAVHDIKKRTSRVIKAEGYAQSYQGKIRWNAYGTAYDSKSNVRLPEYDLRIMKKEEKCM